MKIKKLLKELPIREVHGSKEVEITGVCSNSQSISPGNLFVAKKGHTVNGVQFIPDAIAAGAAAILTDMYDPTLPITQLVYPEVRNIEGLVASAYHGNPSRELFMVGVTGTNGKTTSSYMMKNLLDAVHLGPCGLIGTIEYILGKLRYQAVRTTPDVCSNQKMLREMCNQGCKSAVMEVTSHALVQNRVDSIDFDVAAFTNLTLDHLDYHGTMEEYCAAKNKLFRFKSLKKAIVNQDSEWREKIVEGCSAEILTYGIDQPADLQVKEMKLTPSGTKITLHYKNETISTHWPFIGRFNAYNCLASVAVALSQNIPLEQIAETLPHVPPVPGRLEPVPNNLGLKIYVDYAHSDDALINVLKTLAEIKQKKMITIFGCGGDRDRFKRPKMAAASEAYSDLTIVTTDNPRGEDPNQIIQEIVKGFTQKSYLVEPDRRKAIEKAIEIASPDDIILIAGKGHEPYQCFAHRTVEFDDRLVAAELSAGVLQ